jgi:hypothetical protein
MGYNVLLGQIENEYLSRPRCLTYQGLNTCHGVENEKFSQPQATLGESEKLLGHWVIRWYFEVVQCSHGENSIHKGQFLGRDSTAICRWLWEVVHSIKEGLE